MPVAANKLAPSRQRVLTFLSPNVQDILFVETVDAQRVGAEIPPYGTPHPDTKRWPDHELVYVKTADEQGQLYQYYYAAKRAAQDKYNLEFNGDEATRTYILPRSDGQDVINPLDVDDINSPDFSLPPGMVPVGYSISRTDTELDSLYYVLKKRYIVGRSVEVFHNDELDTPVTVVKEVVPRGAGEGGGESSPGRTVEFRSGNAFYDVKITQTCDDADRSLEDLPTFVNYAFPPKLLAVNIVYVSAWATGSAAPPAFDEDFYFEFKLKEPKSGPYPATITRRITANPGATIAELTAGMATLNSPRRETIGMVSAWAYSSPDSNQSKAFAREIEVPASVHNQINITVNDNPELNTGTNTSGILKRLRTTVLPPTEGGVGPVTAFVNADVRKLPLGLYEVRVVKFVSLSVY
jgi:hypothetical protein